MDSTSMNQGSVVPVDETPFKPSSPYYFPVSTSMSAFASQYPDQDHCNIVLYVRNVEMNSTEFIAIAKWAGELKFWGVNTTTKRAFLLYKEYMSALSMFNVLVGYGCLVGLVSQTSRPLQKEGQNSINMGSWPTVNVSTSWW